MNRLKIEQILKMINNSFLLKPKRIIVVEVALQRLHLIENGKSILTFNISTAKNGAGNQEGSNKTPTGVHRIEEKIGDGAPVGRIFKSRVDTGQNWHTGLTDDNLILTRILRLKGLEPGINSGPGIDSYERYIYIHGTNQENRIGTPNSHGCICMKNDEVIQLFNAVEEGTLVVID